MNSISQIRYLLRSSSIHQTSSRTLFNVLEERRLLEGYLPQNKKLQMIETLKKKQTFYTGFDPTGPSLHIGHLLVIMPLLHALRNGHRIICLIGDETARIGDPTGRLKARESLDRETIEANASRISSTLVSIFVNHLKYFWKPKFSEPIHEPIILNNSNWYSDDKFSDIIAECGPAINVRNLFRKSRVEEHSENYSYAQLSYAVMQAYDWLKLFDRHNCCFQVGGNDQTPNIEAGFSLIRNLRNQEVYGFFVPLLLDKEGKKMGKTEGKSLFLERFTNSPYSLYKAILKLPHNQIERFLRYFTFYNNQEIESIIQKDLKKQTLHAHEKLADSIVLLIHGESGLNQAKNASKALLKGETEALGKLTEDDLKEVFGSESFIYHELVPFGTSLLNIIMKTNFFENEDLATVMINKGGVLVNGRKILDTDYLICDNDVFPNNLTFIKIGTNRAYLIRWL